jgi:beta,beta-carotene 9',10'-dioxygenase
MAVNNAARDTREVERADGGDTVSTTQAAYALGLKNAEDHPDPVRLSVAGEIPGWLHGALLRTAPARFDVGRTGLTHWFDGHAMLHRFDIDRGQVTYRSRYLESAAATEAQEAGELVRGEFGTDPCRTVFERVAAVFHQSPLTDNCNVNVVARGDVIMALTETPMRLTFDPETLVVGQLKNDAADISGQIATAHPHHDRNRSTIYSYLLHLGLKSTYKMVATDDRTGQHRMLAAFDVNLPSYVHSFGMSENFLIMALPPFVVDPTKLVVSGKPFIRNYHWRPELGLRFFVIDKRDGQLMVEAKAPSVFTFHHVNAFEENSAVIVDLVVYPDASIVERLDLDQMRSANPTAAIGALRRYRIDLGSGTTKDTPLSSTEFEFPRTNDAAIGGRPYRFVYGAGARNGDLHDCIVKVDVATGNAIQWAGLGLYPGEPVFVPNPNSTNEDAGVLLSVVLDVEAGTSCLVVLDASSLNECARALAPRAITFGFHGGFFPR